VTELVPGPWLTAAEAASHVRSASVKAFYEWAKRHCLVPRHKGRQLLFDRRDLDRALKAKRPVHRMNPASLANLRKKSA
jgi:hypothetical protein